MREQRNQYDAYIGTMITGVLAVGLSGLRSDFLWMKHPNRSHAPSPQSFDTPPSVAERGTGDHTVQPGIP